MSLSSSASSKTLPLAVANTGFMLDRMGMDCDPLQFLRELTQNSIEAILKTTEKSGSIVWDVDWITYDLDGRFKLSITDTGIGMTGEEMRQYINHLSSSSNIQSYVANFGIGAKIAAATRNPAGMAYLSWKNGVGYYVYLWRDPVTGDYGLQQIERPDGTFGHWAGLDDDVKPDLIKKHGTKVVLYGKAAEENTMTAPPGAMSPSRWITRYLNTRYFRFPQGITVKCREGWEHDRSDTDRNVLRTITGQRAYLESHKLSSGTVQLTNANAHWWILKNENALSSNSGYINSAGHVAALWQDELYEMTTGRANTAALQNFGVVFGYQQVVIYVEPSDGQGIEIYPNTARTQLLFNNRSLPWSDWQEEFRAAMPKEITAHMEAVAAAADKSDHSSSIKERLKQIEELYKLSRYRPIKNGPLMVTAETQALGGGAKNGSDGKASGGGGGGTQGRGNTKSVYAMFLSPDGVPGEEVKPDIYPKIDWITVSNGTRAPGDLEDRAARYLRPQNQLLINADFRVFTDMVKRWEQQSSHVPNAHTIVMEVVKEWFEQSLVEVVLSSNALRDGQHWNIQDIDKLLSEEALTAAVLPRYHIEYSIKRSLGAKLGSFAKTKFA